MYYLKLNTHTYTHTHILVYVNYILLVFVDVLSFVIYNVILITLLIKKSYLIATYNIICFWMYLKSEKQSTATYTVFKLFHII